MDYMTEQTVGMPEEQAATAMPEEVTGQMTSAAAPAVPRGFDAHKAAGNLGSFTDLELKVARFVWGREGLKIDKVVQDVHLGKGVVAGAFTKLEKLKYLTGMGSHKSSTYSWNPDKK